MFNGQLIPEINEGTNDRLYLDRPSGSLIITKSKITDSGVYQLNMISSSHTVQRDISVTVIGEWIRSFSINIFLFTSVNNLDIKSTYIYI